MPKAGEHYLSERKRRFVDEYLKTCDGWDLSTGRKREAATAAGYADPRQCYKLLGSGGKVKCHAVYRYLCSLAPEGVTFEFVGKPIDTERAKQKAAKAKRDKAARAEALGIPQSFPQTSPQNKPQSFPQGFPQTTPQGFPQRHQYKDIVSDNIARLMQIADDPSETASNRINATKLIMSNAGELKPTEQKEEPSPEDALREMMRLLGVDGDVDPFT
jgi:hypothetical protein